MADTIITNSPERSSESSAGWFVALIIIIAVVAGGILLYKRGAFSRAPAPSNDTNINVTIPNPIDSPGQSSEPNPEPL